MTSPQLTLSALVLGLGAAALFWMSPRTSGAGPAGHPATMIQETGGTDQEQGQESEPAVDPALIDRLNIEPVLREADGVLGVRSARWKGEGREALFAWFEDKEALLDFYLTEEHLDASEAIFRQPLDDGHEVLAHLPEESGPLLVIFYIAGDPSNPGRPELTLPLTAFSIEIYTPAPGGITLMEGFAPEGLKIPHHRRLLTER